MAWSLVKEEMMKAQNNAISIIIPTYKRSQFLKRLLSYYQSQSCPYPIIVADSSPEPHKSENESIVDSVMHSLHIDYKHYDSTINFYTKVSLALEVSNSKYTVICADDDFIIPGAIAECVKWLDANPDYSVVHGRSLRVEYKNHDKIPYFNYNQRTLNNQDSVLRFKEHFANYTTTFYSVHKRLDHIYNFCLTENVSDDRFGELLLSGLSVIQGKTMCLDTLYMVRQSHSGGANRNNLNWFQLLTSNNYSEKYTKFRDCLAQELIKTTGLSWEQAKEAINQGWFGYLHLLLQRIPRLNVSCAPDTKWMSRLNCTESNDSAELEQIVQCFKSAAQETSNISISAEKHLEKGKILHKKGDIDAAIKCYLRAVEVDNSLALAHAYLGSLYCQQNKMSEGFDCYKRAINLKPSINSEDLEAYSHFVEVLAQQNNSDFADKSLTTESQIRLILVPAGLSLLNVMSILRFQENTKEYLDRVDICVIVGSQDNAEQLTKVILELAKSWNFVKILSVNKLTEFLLWITSKKKGKDDFITWKIILKKALNIENIDVLYAVTNTGLYNLFLEAYSDVRVICYGDSIGQLKMNRGKCFNYLNQITPVNDAYLIAPFEVEENSFNQCNIQKVEPNFFRDVVYESSERIKSLYSQSLKELTSQGPMTIILSSHLTRHKYVKDIDTEIKVTMDCILPYVQRNETVFIKGHPYAQNQSNMLVNQLSQKGIKAVSFGELNYLPIEILIPLFKPQKAITLMSSSCISIAYLSSTTELIIGFGEKLINQYFLEREQAFMRGTKKETYNVKKYVLIAEYAFFLMTQQAYRKKFEPIRYSKLEKEITQFHQEPIYLNHNNL